jgi:hypothetical protein
MGMNQLVPCPECSRHVRVSELECPFCALPLELSGTPPPRLPGARLSRAATLAFGATIASATGLVACVGTSAPAHSPPVEAGSAGAAGSGAAGPSAGGAAGSDIRYAPVAIYGAPG